MQFFYIDDIIPLYIVRGGREDNFTVKRVLSVLLIALILSLTGICASADDAPAISVSSAEAHPGEEVILTVELSNNPGIVGMTVGFDYNADVLALESMTQSGLLGAWFKEVKAAWASTVGDQDYNGVFLTLKFKVSETAGNGVYPVGIICSPGDICNNALEIVDFKLNSGSITVTGAKTAPTPTAQPSPTAQYAAAPYDRSEAAVPVSRETVLEEIISPEVLDTASETIEKTEEAPAEASVKPEETEKPTDETASDALTEETADESKPETTEAKTPVGVYAFAAVAAVCVVAAVVIIIRKR